MSTHDFLLRKATKAKLGLRRKVPATSRGVLGCCWWTGVTDVEQLLFLRRREGQARRCTNGHARGRCARALSSVSGCRPEAERQPATIVLISSIKEFDR